MNGAVFLALMAGQRSMSRGGAAAASDDSGLWKPRARPPLALVNPETLAQRRTRLEREMAVFGLTPKDYEMWQLQLMGYHERRTCRPKDKK